MKLFDIIYIHHGETLSVRIEALTARGARETFHERHPGAVIISMREHL